VKFDRADAKRFRGAGQNVASEEEQDPELALETGATAGTGMEAMAA
jgi:hypothetical protein